jgi:hypothetical protein
MSDHIHKWEREMSSGWYWECMDCKKQINSKTLGIFDEYHFDDSPPPPVNDEPIWIGGDDN